jgi:lipoprotein-anchoring transpeptidase ErfK/SrfK
VNAGYKWDNEAVVGVRGLDGRSLDIDGTVARLKQNLAALINHQHLELVMTTVEPEVSDPSPYLGAAQELASQPIEFTGYDPFIDQAMTWTTNPETFVSWLEAGTAGLVLRESTFLPFVEAQNATLHESEKSRFLDQKETAAAMREAITAKQHTVSLRIRYHPSTYTVVPGDSGYRIARKAGIPYFLIEQANPGQDLSVLSPGDTVNLPSQDVSVPLKPVANKRIVVNLETQWLVAYENGQEVFSWAISSGIAEAPTYPGTFQILSHEPVAYGSSYRLCGDAGCGEWELNWFMGIYEVVPGLANGFHGAVLLPNGTYLGGNNVGRPYTLGCIMSRDDDAKKLYDWAEEGTVVEIISSEYQPRSELGRLMLNQGL